MHRSKLRLFLLSLGGLSFLGVLAFTYFKKIVIAQVARPGYLATSFPAVAIGPRAALPQSRTAPRQGFGASRASRPMAHRSVTGGICRQARQARPRSARTRAPCRPRTFVCKEGECHSTAMVWERAGAFDGVGLETPNR